MTTKPANSRLTYNHSEEKGLRKDFRAGSAKVPPVDCVRFTSWQPSPLHCEVFLHRETVTQFRSHDAQKTDHETPVVILQA